MSANSAPSTDNIASPQPKQNKCKKCLMSCLYTPYLVNWHFVIQVIIFVFSICGSASAGWAHTSEAATQYFIFVCLLSIVICSILVFINLFGLVEKFKNKVPWAFIEMIIDALFAILFLIGASICTAYGRNDPAYTHYLAAAFFGFALTVVFIIKGVIDVIRWRRNAKERPPAQTNANPAPQPTQPIY